jgi:hypothetical protein
MKALIQFPGKKARHAVTYKYEKKDYDTFCAVIIIGVGGEGIRARCSNSNGRKLILLCRIRFAQRNVCKNPFKNGFELVISIFGSEFSSNRR